MKKRIFDTLMLLVSQQRLLLPIRGRTALLFSLLFISSSLLQAQDPPIVSGEWWICEGTTTTLTANGQSGATFEWYDAPTGGNLLATTPDYTTPVLTTTTFYYVSQTVGATTSARREQEVRVFATPNPAEPASVTATPATICIGETSSLSATVDSARENEVFWYDAPTGGNLLGKSTTGENFNVTPTSTTTYYAQSEVEIVTNTYNYTGGVQTFTVPADIYSLTVDAYGARGGIKSYGSILPGQGGRVETTLNVTPGQVLNIYVGGAGSNHYGGWNGGGSASSNTSNNTSGGGATDIRIGGTTLNDRVVVAGGGGGVGYPSSYGTFYGGPGHGGGLVGTDGGYYSSGPSESTRGKGGTQTAGGRRGCGYSNSGCGTTGSFGQGGSAGSYGGWRGGAGGGGWYGGGGATDTGLGGGGSSYTDPALCSNVIHTKGVRNSHGTLSISYTVSPNCASTNRVPVMVTVNPLPTVNASNNVYSCPGVGVTLTASGADTYVWEPGTLTGSSIMVDPSTTTTYTVTGTITATGCTSTDQVQVSVSELVGPSDRTICEGSATTLTASGSDTYSWEPGSLSGASVSVSPTVTTTYTLNSSDPSGCTDMKTVTVTVNTRPVITTSNDTLVGKNFPANLSASGADTYSWNPGSINSSTATVTPLSTTTYTVRGTLSATGCYRDEQVTVSVIDLPSVNGELTKISGDTTTLTATGPSGSTFEWFDSITAGNSLANTAVFNTPVLSENKTFYVALSNSGNTSPRIGVNVTVIDTSLSNVTSSQSVICPGESIDLSAEMGSPGRVKWYDASTGGTLVGHSTTSTPLNVTPGSSQNYYAVCETEEKNDTFNYTGNVQTFTVPDGVTSIKVDAYGARGGKKYGGLHGRGGRVQSTLNVTPGQVLQIYVGGKGQGYADPTRYSNYPGGWNGGGNNSNNSNSSSGGGATDIRIGGNTLYDRVIVAGGAGGMRYNSSGTYRSPSSHGGGLTGGAGGYYTSGSGSAQRGTGGTQTRGGNRGCWHGGSSCGQNGSFGQGGNSGSSSGHPGGAGGGGWYGGGGGTANGDGGGGSSYTDPILCSNVIHTQGVRSDHGMLIITYSLDNTANTRTMTAVTVEDNDAPVPDVATLPDVEEQYSVTLTPPTAMDNCAGAMTATTSDPTTYNAQGTYIVNWVFDDGNGLQTVQQQTVRITSSLPVELTDFSLKCIDEDVMINWSTASELNNDYFEIEASNDAEQWQVLKRVEGAGNSSAAIDYSYTEKKQAGLFSLFRLKQVDFDGTTSYSAIKSIRCKEQKLMDLAVYPNPVSNECNIVIDDREGERLNIQLSNEQGRLIRQEQIEVRSSTQLHTLSMEDLVPGVYYIQVTSNSESFTFKIVKIKL